MALWQALAVAVAVAVALVACAATTGAAAAGVVADYELVPMNTNGPQQLHHSFFTFFLPPDAHNATGHYWRLDVPSAANAYQLLPAPSGCSSVSNVSTSAAKYGCELASNAGFFDRATNSCIGNVVSNGDVVQLASAAQAQNVNFGVSGDGSAFVVGYLPTAWINNASAPAAWQQLVQGTPWLVRDGQYYLNTSMQIEGTSMDFALEQAPRLAIGHDAAGRLVLVAVHGVEVDLTGANLFQFTELLLDLGLTNAINIDGGGSVTLVYKGTVCTSNGVFVNACLNGGDGDPAAAAAIPPERPVTTLNCILAT